LFLVQQSKIKNKRRRKRDKRLKTGMEIIVSMIASKIIDYTIKPVGQWLCYSFHYTSNIRSMKEQVEELRLASERLQHSVGAAISNCLEIEGDVKKWLEDAAVIIELAGQVVEGEKEEAKKCCNGACLNLKLKIRHQLSRKAKKIVQDIGELLLKKRSSERVAFLPAPRRKVTAGSMDYVASKSRMLTVTRLMEALEDDKIHLIGLWGMAGVGKSTLVREIADQAMKKKLFDEVAIANVTQSPKPRRIQGEIADTLHLKFDTEETILGRASRLRERLTKKTDKKIILVILDDIWKNLDLKEIGIPYEGCKVLLTSRDRDLLVSGMGTQKDFGLEVLAKEEAWSLFEKMAGDCVKDPNLQHIAKDVAKACAGLPLALVTVSKALKNKELFEWNDALQLLRRPTPDNLKEMQSTIYSSIELSYKHLENKVVQEVFLLCAQLASYIDERYVLRYCYSLGLFQGINTMEEARNKVSTIVRTLKDSCLLLPSPYSSKFIRMHDLVRDAAIIIASRDKNMFVMRTDGGLKEWPNADALKRCKAFSVLGGDIHELPNQMECSELRFLLVYGGERPLPISNTFFIGIEQLKVLDFTKMQFSSLPSSLHLLINLQTLCLDRCVLGDITVIGELENLVVLSLNHSEISKLPREIGLLSRLRLLDLSNCSKLEVIPPNILSRLVKLEELYMRNSFIQWEAEGLNNGRNNASLAELEHLLHLITLEIQIPNANSLPKDLSFEKLERYIISVGDECNWSYGQGESSRTLKLKLNTSFQSQIGIKMILNKTENLYLDELNGVKSVLHELDWEGFRQLKHLHIQNNYEIKYIMNLMMPVVAFPALETFHLKKMTSLEEICHGELCSSTSFGNLRVLKVEHCDKLKFVFSSSIAGGLSQLEELEIRECNNMGAIVMKEKGAIEEERTLNLFPQLRRLVLKHLPKLMSFLSTQTSHVTDAGEITSKCKPDFHMPILHEQV
jgi:hypothetical protein